MKYKYIAAVALALVSASASAQDRTYILTVSAAEVGVIGAALGARPYAEVAPLLNKLNDQIREQDKPKAAPEPEKPAGGK